MRILVRAGTGLLIALHLVVTIGMMLIFVAGGYPSAVLAWAVLAVNLAAWGLLAWRRTRGTWMVFLAHVLAVLPMIWVFVTVWREPQIDANIGAGFLGFYLLAWGLPGSLLAFTGYLGDSWSNWFPLIAMITPVLNLVLHAGWLIRRHRAVPLQPAAV
ncbi:hypothetical protein ACTOB_005808 [Actinoplanes oblitus]|uniref:Uncharacterized protein n=1 Tax=Actinoplanes oblitus TaxID=3040509 RepID=A0ABY8W8J5_9ACTN|nr:hypothetical protein [Actinoplanes oblitus]WIM93817.1 hypothetical protein ACTOB_005808 [Actinoplanes oblitus]